MNAERTLAPALGWFGIALGALELASPKTVARAIGTHNHSTVVRAFGAREIGAGVAVLSRRKPASGLWMRVFGDVLDLGAIALSMRDEHNDRRRLRLAMGVVAAVMAADVYAALAVGNLQRAKRPIIAKSVAFMATRDEMFAVLADSSWLQRCVPGLANATVTADEANLATSSFDYHISGVGPLNAYLRVTLSDLAPDRGTMLRVEAFPRMASGRAVRALAEIPGDALAMGLHRLKNIVELGEIVSNDGPSGRNEKTARA